MGTPAAMTVAAPERSTSSGTPAASPGRMDRFRLLAIAGSLRRDSFNRRLLEAALTLAPPDVDWEIARIRDIPLYDADLEAAGLPLPVERFKTQIERADALLIATPEYNAGIPGPLKNAIDWASRPAFRSPLVEKPVALIAASPSRRPPHRVLDQLRQVLASTITTIVEPPVAVAAVHERLRHDGELDPALRNELAQLMQRLVAAKRSLAVAS